MGKSDRDYDLFTHRHNFCRAKEIASPHKKRWRTINWSQLDAKSYYELIRQLRGCLRKGQPMWMLEESWTVTDS